MILTHLVLFSFFDGASGSDAPPAVAAETFSGGYFDYGTLKERYSKARKKELQEELAKELAEEAEITLAKARNVVKKVAREYPDFPLEVKKPESLTQDRVIPYSEWIKPILDWQERQRIIQQRNNDAIAMLLALAA